MQAFNTKEETTHIGESKLLDSSHQPKLRRLLETLLRKTKIMVMQIPRHPISPGGLTEKIKHRRVDRRGLDRQVDVHCYEQKEVIGRSR